MRVEHEDRCAVSMFHAQSLPLATLVLGRQPGGSRWRSERDEGDVV